MAHGGDEKTDNSGRGIYSFGPDPLQQVDDGQQSREHTDKESQLVAHGGFF